MKSTFTLVLLFFSFDVSAQKYLGDKVFYAYKDSSDFHRQFNFYNSIDIGHLFDDNTKHGLVFQQIDSVNYLNQLKIYSFVDGEITEKVIIDTLEIGLYYQISFVDKNFDGYKDLILTLAGNREWDEVFLYEPEIDSLIEIPSFFDYPDTKQAGNSNFLYSYKATGCADSCWISNLIRIENFKVVEYGEIYGDGCSELENKITVTFNNDSTTKTIPYTEIDKYEDYKWGFIKEYWENYVESRDN